MLLNKSKTSTTLDDNLIIRFPKFGTEQEGFLSVADGDRNCPFQFKRAYWVYGCPDRKQRGSHAHRNLHQILICLAGEVEVILTDGFEKKVFVLNDPTVGLHLKPLIWADLIHRNQTALLVLASDHYSEAEYIRSYEEFKTIIAAEQ